MALSLRTKISLTITLTGVLTVALVLAVAEVYKRSSYDDRRQTLEQTIARAAGHQRDRLSEELISLAYALQGEADFRDSLAATGTDTLSVLLQLQFQRYFATEGIIRLQRIAVYDTRFQTLGRAVDPVLRLEGQIACDRLAASASRRIGTDRLKAISALCVSRGRAYFAVIVPIGGLRPLGYFHLEADPVPALAQLEYELGSPIQIIAPNGQPIWQSDHWPQDTGSSDTIIAGHTVLTSSGDTVVGINVANDIRPLRTRLDITLYVLLSLVTLATIAAAVITRRLMERSFVAPLETLARHAQYIHEDKSRLGEQVSIQGDREVQQVAATINFMSTELRNLYGTLQYVTTTDPQTQLPNRLQMDTSIEQLIALYQERGMQFAVLLFAVEQTKSAGTFGNALPDERLILHVAARLRDITRSTDMVAPIAAFEHSEEFQNVARLDGNEFAVILPGAGDFEHAMHAAGNYVRHLKSPLIVEDIVLSVELNVGIALFPKHATTASRLLRCAGTALAESKRLGGEIHVYNDEHEYYSIQRFDLEHDLRRALARGQLSVHYQPQVDTRSRQLHRAEALMRWHHHEQDVIPPDVFIPLAEQINVIRPLTHWVLEQSIGDCARWRALGHDLGVAVNVAPNSLRDPEFTRRVLALLDQHRLPAAQLAIEITERGHHGQLSGIATALNELLRAGVCISVDDFGMGYPTLAQLKQLPLRQLKIDKSFVLGMLNDEHDATVIKATIDIARQRGLEIVAEGVELQGQWDRLQNLGVDFAQGFLIAHPMSHDDLIAWLNATTAGHNVWVPRSAAS